MSNKTKDSPKQKIHGYAIIPMVRYNGRLAYEVYEKKLHNTETRRYFFWHRKNEDYFWSCCAEFDTIEEALENLKLRVSLRPRIFDENGEEIV